MGIVTAIITSFFCGMLYILALLYAIPNIEEMVSNGGIV
jgi:hypothetical protein